MMPTILLSAAAEAVFSSEMKAYFTEFPSLTPDRFSGTVRHFI
jgi:hypothetical protein